MGKAKQRTVVTIIVMSLMAVAIILFYLYWTSRTNSPGGTPEEDLSDAQKLIQKDLELYYPETPREVVKLYGNMMKVLYNELEDDEIKALALKIRELYDTELLDNNPESAYLNDLYTDLAEWEEKDRRIANFLLINEDQEKKSEINGVSYAVINLAFTIQENVKFTETWRVLVRQDNDGKWKIMGWEVLPETTDQE